jgi:hypothetical protein
VPFRPILQRLIDAHPQAIRAVILCDHEGERVDAVSVDVPVFDVDVAGASFAIAAHQIGPGPRLRVVCDAAAFWVIALELDCYVVVWCRKGHERRCERAVSGAVGALSAALSS